MKRLLSSFSASVLAFAIGLTFVWFYINSSHIVLYFMPAPDVAEVEIPICDCKGVEIYARGFNRLRKLRSLEVEIYNCSGRSLRYKSPNSDERICNYILEVEGEVHRKRCPRGAAKEYVLPSISVSGWENIPVTDENGKSLKGKIRIGLLFKVENEDTEQVFWSNKVLY